MNQTQSFHNETLNQYEKLVRAGRGSLVRRSLMSANLKDIPYHLKAPLAEIARRVGVPDLSLKILDPLIKVASHFRTLDSSVRLAYGSALVEVGALQWGKKVLSSLSQIDHPQSLIFRSFAHFKEWRSDLAIPLLKNYCDSFPKDTYEALIGQLNLASAFIAVGEYDSATEILPSLIKTAKQKHHQLIWGSGLELLGQTELLTGNSSLARSHLQDAVEALKDSYILPSLWAQKWSAINEILYFGKSRDDLFHIRSLAEKLKDYETIRDCDLFLSKHLANSSLASKVYFGSPFKGYRRRFFQIMDQNSKFLVKPNYVRRWDVNSRFTMNIYDGTLNPPGLDLEFGSLPHKMLFLLASDFYRPMTVANIFSFLFQDEQFDPYGSPPRVHQVLNRLRSWAKDAQIVLDISISKGQFNLQHSSIDLFFPKPIELDDFYDLYVEKLKRVFESRSFSVHDVSETFKTSVRSAQKTIKKYLDNGILTKYGAGKLTQYTINNPIKS